MIGAYILSNREGIMTRFSWVVSVLFCLIISANAQPCGPSPAWDSGASYSRSIYVSPDGDDTNGTGEKSAPFQTLERAAREAAPGTRILLAPGSHRPGQYIADLQGTENAPIWIGAEIPDQPPLFEGGNTAFQLSDPAYLILENLAVAGASANGINIDDGADYSTPAHHVILRGLSVRDVGPSGNHDGIKLSGLNEFLVERCAVTRPGSGGSAIDMVGCHDGLIAFNHFEEIGSSGVQAKGGSARVTIYANVFFGGERAVNLGGSTGLDYFRPIDAPYEAAHITAWANTFHQCQTPAAFVGSEYCLFAHNTVYLPGKWAARILQENTGARFVQSRYGVYANNIVVIDDQVSTLVNVGPNTQPDTFRFAGNLFFHKSQPGFQQVLPGEEFPNGFGLNPEFVNAPDDFHLRADSPAFGASLNLHEAIGDWPIEVPKLGDVEGVCWKTPAAVGALQSGGETGATHWPDH
ncbi:MAG: hypothetical protein GC154_00870 [bacterium]|nr:hypothetical protein [bacterium]